MRTMLLTMLVTAHALTGCAVKAGHAVDPDVPAAKTTWDAPGVARMVDAAREARAQGDLTTAERLCYTAFLTVDRSALVSYDAYADLLKAEHRAEEPGVREQAARLRESKRVQSQGTQPSSNYLGFAPTATMNAYADLLQTLDRRDESQRVRSLAVAYQQVQQAHFERTMLYRQGKDPRGHC